MRRLRPPVGLAAALCVAGLGGCLQLEPGLSGRQAEIARVRATGEGFRFLETGPDRARIAARGTEIVIRPMEGLCLTSGSFAASDDGAFAVLADCVMEQVAPLPEPVPDTPLALPPAFPGLMTVAVSSAPMAEIAAAGGAEPDAMGRLAAFLGSQTGRAMLGRNGSGESVEVVETLSETDTLLVHVRDRHEGGLALLAADFWRGFLTLKGRLVLVTVSGFRDRPLGSDEMRAVLRAQLARIKSDNPARATAIAATGVRRPGTGEGADDAREIASAGRAAPDGADTAPAAPDPAEVAAVEREFAAAVAEWVENAGTPGESTLPGPGAPETAARPPRRPGSGQAADRMAGGPTIPGPEDTGSDLAPRRAPLAPSRPRRG